jgi:hypothetical protein
MSVTDNTKNKKLIGRQDLDDIEAILAMSNHDEDGSLHYVTDNAPTIFTWDYETRRPQLRKLYEKAKTGQWNAETDFDWKQSVDIEGTITADQAITGAGLDPSRYADTPIAKWGDKEWLNFGIEGRNWTLSQFLHGEQGALICTAKITQTVPWHDAKLYSATQVMDEARHVEVFAKYLNEKLGGEYPINIHLRMLLDDIINDGRWDMTYLGMQIMVEGLALAAFGFMHQLTTEPLLKQILRMVMSDEARHVAFGVISLQEVYAQMSDSEIKERQEFAYEASVRMRDRFLQQEVWERMGLKPREILPFLMGDPTRIMFQQMLFAKIVPNCKKLGLLDRNDKWLRHRFEEMGVIKFETWENTADDYLAFEIGKEIKTV